MKLISQVNTVCQKAHNQLRKRGGGVCLYLHSVIQYKLRNDLKLGNDPELVNSVFVEIEKSTIGKKCDCWLHGWMYVLLMFCLTICSTHCIKTIMYFYWEI